MKKLKFSRRIKDKVKQTVRDSSARLVWLGRLGFAAKGIVFVIVGGLAAYAAIGAGAANDGVRNSLRYIVELPFGQFLLGAVAFGLVFHALWQIIQALMDTENKGSKAAGIAVRAGFAGIALIYVGLAFSAVKIILGAKRGGFWARSWTAWLLALPFGEWLVGLAGAIIVAVGFFQFYQAFTAKFRETLLLEEMSETEKTWVIGFGRFGFASRGVIFCVIGFFFVLAAYQADAGEARGLGGALRAVEQQTFGAWLLGLVAAGFVSYGLFMFALAKYRRMVIT